MNRLMRIKCGINLERNYLIIARSDEHDCSCDNLPENNLLRPFNELLRKAGSPCLDNPDTKIDVKSIMIDNVK